MPFLAELKFLIVTIYSFEAFDINGQYTKNCTKNVILVGQILSLNTKTLFPTLLYYKQVTVFYVSFPDVTMYSPSASCS